METGNKDVSNSILLLWVIYVKVYLHLHFRIQFCYCLRCVQCFDHTSILYTIFFIGVVNSLWPVLQLVARSSVIQ